VAYRRCLRPYRTRKCITLVDGDLAEAILDRLLERGSHYVLRGRSYRTRHLKEDTATAADQDAA
jgi:DNA replication protein DnaC